MNRIKVVFYSLFLFVQLLNSVNALEWTEEDAIYIEDGAIAARAPIETLSEIPTVDNPIDINLNSSTEAPAPPLVTAIPVEIIPGQCVKASECYPILFYYDYVNNTASEEPQVVDQNLYKFILSTANACEPSDLPESVARGIDTSEDVYLWCPQRSFSSKPPRTHAANLFDSESSTNVPQQQPEVECGPVRTTEEEELKARVVGGESAKLGEFPWMVALTNRGNLFCSGSLIDESHVLLAAHCVSHLRYRDLKNIKVLIGDHDIKDPTDILHQERNVSAVIFHRNFSMRTVHSDVGMLRLSKPVVFADNVLPICLSNEDINDDGSSYGILSGWGATKEGSRSSATLMKTTIRIWRQDECSDKYKGIIPGGILDSMVCAGSLAPIIKDACKGDSGGPLAQIKGDRMEQIGIVSFGIGCGRSPGVFSRIRSYYQWIEKHRSRSSKYFL